MPAYVLAQGRVEDQEKVNRYLAGAGGTLAPHDAKVLVYTETPEVIEGELANNRTVLIEFPDMAAARAWYDSPDYAAVRGLRQEGAPGTLIMLEGMG